MEGVFTAEAVIDNGTFGTHTNRRNRRLARLAAGSAVATLDDETVILSATTAGKHPKEGLDFFPSRWTSRSGCTRSAVSRILLPPRRPPVRGRDPHLPPHRPAAAAFVRQGSPQRSSGRRDDPRAQSWHLYDVVAINAASLSTLLAGLPFSGPIAACRSP